MVPPSPEQAAPPMAISKDNLISTLDNCLNPDQQRREQSERVLEMLSATQFEPLMVALMQVILDPMASITVKQQAGVYLKNSVYCKDKERLPQLHARWLSMMPTSRDTVKKGLLYLLENHDDHLAQVAGVVLGKVFAAEQKDGGWDTLVDVLCAMVGSGGSSSSSSSSTADFKTINALHALGFVCAELEEDYTNQDHVNKALTVIIQSINLPEPKAVLYAVNALRNAVHLVSRNFDVPAERDMIMKMLCQAATNQDPKVRVVGFEALALIAERFYNKIGPYMEAIYTITTNTLQTTPSYLLGESEENAKNHLAPSSSSSSLSSSTNELPVDVMRYHRDARLGIGFFFSVCATVISGFGAVFAVCHAYLWIKNNRGSKRVVHQGVEMISDHSDSDFKNAGSRSYGGRQFDDDDDDDDDVLN